MGEKGREDNRGGGATERERRKERKTVVGSRGERGWEGSISPQIHLNSHNALPL